MPAVWADTDMAAERAVTLVAECCKVVKFDAAGPLKGRGGHMPSLHDIATSVAFCRIIRNAAGTRADLLFGTHGQFSTAGPIRMGQAIAPFDPLWHQEPVPPDKTHQISKVAPVMKAPIATGKCLITRFEFAPVLRSGAASVVQPALGRCGGLCEARKIAVPAEAYNAQAAPTFTRGLIEWAANIQLAAATPNILMEKPIETPFHFALIKNKLAVQDSYSPSPPSLICGSRQTSPSPARTPTSGPPCTRRGRTSHRLPRAQCLCRQRPHAGLIAHSSDRLNSPRRGPSLLLIAPLAHE